MSDDGDFIDEDLEECRIECYSDDSGTPEANKVSAADPERETTSSPKLETEGPSTPGWEFHTLGHFDFGATGNLALGSSETLWKASQLISDSRKHQQRKYY